MFRALVLWVFTPFFVFFLAPVIVAALWWSVQDRPTSWRAADWGPSGILPAAETVPEATIHVLAARTGGAKGAVSVHSWLVFKAAGAPRWTRAEVVGWGRPVRLDAYAPDARWYSNVPWVVGSVSGPDAARLLPTLQEAIRAYPWAERGDYVIWPGPNSNTFVGHILRQIPESGLALPPHAVGRDWTGPGIQIGRDGGGDFHMTYQGLAGVAVGPRAGLEVHLFGQAFGFDLRRPALKLPAIGRVGAS